VSARVIWRSRLSHLYQFLLAPRSPDKDVARRELILNILLVTYCVLGLLASTIVLFFSTYRADDFSGSSIYVVGFITTLFFWILVLSRLGYLKIAGHIFMFLTVLPVYYTSYQWGMDVPQASLLFGLTIIMAGVLFDAPSAIFLALIHASYLIPLSYLQGNNLAPYDTTWKLHLPTTGDGIVVSAMLGVAAIISWLSNREVEKALHRARTSEAELKQERDLLEIKVKERTKKLQETQQAQMQQFYQFAELGRLASGLFHDLANPLTAASLELESLAPPVNQHRRSKYEKALQRASESLQRMENFIVAAKKQIQKQEITVAFSPIQEIQQVLSILKHKAHKNQIEITIVAEQAPKLRGNPIKFSQIISNIISNALDAYPSGQVYSQRAINITVKTLSTKLKITITDWGVGINAADVRHIFEPLFTTKDPSSGTGLGLSMAKAMIEKDFHGSITCHTQPGKGTSFVLYFSLNSNPR